MTRRPVILHVLCFLATAMVMAGVLWVLGWLFQGDVTGRDIREYGKAELARAVEARDVSFTPSTTYYLHEDPWTAAEKKRPEPKGQAPVLAELVNEKKLPPLTDRLPDEPYVSQGCEGIGEYGGTWLRVATSPGDVGIITWRLNGAKLARWSALGYPVKPFVAKSITASPDRTQWLVTLRKGMKWSDGHPFTADDIMFWWEDNVLNTTVSGVAPPYMIVGGQAGRIERVKDTDGADADENGFEKYQVRFVFPKPYGMFMERMAIRSHEIIDRPKHYLKPWHPTLGDEARCKRAMAAYKLGSRLALYSHMRNFKNPYHPRLWAWVCRKHTSSPPHVFIRNPYYFAVDPAGNQLPYIDRVQFDIQPKDILAVTAINGMVSMQTRHIEYRHYTEYMSRRDASAMRVLHWYPATRSIYALNPNHVRYVDPKDPTTKYKAALLADKRFRQALSLAIDRRRIITAEYNDQVEPAQVSPGQASPFRHDKLRKAYTQYDPNGAKTRLDALVRDGLLGPDRDSEGYRTFPDGSRMVFYIDFCGYTGVGPTEFVIKDWADTRVGIRAVAREQSRPLLYTRKDSMDFDFNIWSAASDYLPLCCPRYFVAYDTECFYAVGWGKWFKRGGFYTTAGENPAAYWGGASKQPPRDHPMYRAMQIYENALQAPTLERQVAIFSEALDIAAEELWTINLTEAPPQLVVVKKDFRNIPDNALYGHIFHTPDNAQVETFYFDQTHPKDSAGAVADTKHCLVTPSPRPGDLEAMGRDDAAAPAGAPRPPHRRNWGRTIVGLVLLAGLVVLPVVLAVLGHPYVLRRVLIMVPTLIVISVVVFVVIQAPPGNFLTAKRIELAESGDPALLQDLKDLENYFHVDESKFSQYLRWMGVRWFMPYTGQEKARVTAAWEAEAAAAKAKGAPAPPKPGLGFFREENEGLLQGNMGRSMEDPSRTVNDLVGDRIWLTVGISLGTILFTWAIAIPVGIYSAVRQYSLGDYYCSAT